MKLLVWTVSALVLLMVATCLMTLPDYGDALVEQEARGVSVPYLTATPSIASSVAAFYAFNCASCHGENRQGGVGPALLPDTLTETDAHYYGVLRGHVGMPARPSNAEGRLLLAYLRSGQ
jgi:mono/diheme cytochrome c family protein